MHVRGLSLVELINYTRYMLSHVEIVSYTHYVLSHIEIFSYTRFVLSREEIVSYTHDVLSHVGILVMHVRCYLKGLRLYTLCVCLLVEIFSFSKQGPDLLVLASLLLCLDVVRLVVGHICPLFIGY